MSQGVPMPAKACGNGPLVPSDRCQATRERGIQLAAVGWAVDPERKNRRARCVEGGPVRDRLILAYIGEEDLGGGDQPEDGGLLPWASPLTGGHGDERDEYDQQRPL